MDLFLLTLYVLMDSSFWFDTINLGWSIVYTIQGRGGGGGLGDYQYCKEQLPYLPQAQNKNKYGIVQYVFI